MPALEAVGVRNASGKLRLYDAPPPFVFSRLEQPLVPETRIFGERFLEGAVYYRVYESGRAAALRKIWSPRPASNERGSGRNFHRMTSAGFELLAHAAFDVYLDRNQNPLVYVQDGCSPPAARLVGQGIPVVGRPFGAFLSRWVRVKGMSNRSRWQWERGNETRGGRQSTSRLRGGGATNTRRLRPMSGMRCGRPFNTPITKANGSGSRPRPPVPRCWYRPASLRVPAAAPDALPSSSCMSSRSMKPTSLLSMAIEKTFSASHSPPTPTSGSSWMGDAWPSGFRFPRWTSPASAPAYPLSKSLSGKWMSGSLI